MSSRPTADDNLARAGTPMASSLSRLDKPSDQRMALSSSNGSIARSPSPLPSSSSTPGPAPPSPRPQQNAPPTGVKQRGARDNWLPDDSAKACMNCNDAFTLVRRRVCLYGFDGNLIDRFLSSIIVDLVAASFVTNVRAIALRSQTFVLTNPSAFACNASGRSLMVPRIRAQEEMQY